MSTSAREIGAVISPLAAPVFNSCNVLELVPQSELTLDLLRSIDLFFDTQRTSHPFQLPEWSTEDSSFSAIVRGGNEIHFFARCDVLWPLGRRRDRIRALTLTRGPVCDDPGLMRAALLQLVRLCQLQGFLYLDINPDWTDGDADHLRMWLQSQGWFASGSPRASLRLDLLPELKSIRASFRKTTRTEIRRAESAGVEIVPAIGLGAKQKFLELYRAMAREKNFAPDSEQHIRGVLGWLVKEPRRGVLLNASLNGETLGGVVAIRAGSRCWYVWGATKKHTPVSVGHLLQWHAIKWAKQQACIEYDLGGYCEEATSGPALFKRGFSETVVRFLPTFRYALNPIKYALLKLLIPGVCAAKAALRTFDR